MKGAARSGTLGPGIDTRKRSVWSTTKPLPYLLLAPAFLVYGFAILVPVAFTFYFSFLEWDGFSEATWVGVDNYQRAFTDPLVGKSFTNASIYVAGALILKVVAGLILAGLLLVPRRGTAFARITMFAPIMLPMSAIALLWSFIYKTDYGLLNGALATAGLEHLQRAWLGDPDTAMLAINIVAGWIYAGFYMTIFYASMRQIPEEVIEAARLDGAGEWRVFWSIRVPLIKTMLGVAVLLCTTSALRSFDLFYVLTNGGPNHATEIPSTLLVRTAFYFGDIGYGSTIAVVLTVTVLVLGIVPVLAQQRSKGEDA